MEHWPSQHTAGYGGAGVWHRDRRRQHSLPLLWHVEDHICLAHGGHGPLQHQLPALWTIEVLVSRCFFFFLFVFLKLSPVTCNYKLLNGLKICAWCTAAVCVNYSY